MQYSHHSEQKFLNSIKNTGNSAKEASMFSDHPANVNALGGPLPLATEDDSESAFNDENGGLKQQQSPTPPEVSKAIGGTVEDQPVMVGGHNKASNGATFEEPLEEEEPIEFYSERTPSPTEGLLETNKSPGPECDDAASEATRKDNDLLQRESIINECVLQLQNLRITQAETMKFIDKICPDLRVNYTETNNFMDVSYNNRVSKGTYDADVNCDDLSKSMQSNTNTSEEKKNAGNKGEGSEKPKIACEYCGKEFVNIGNHKCKSKPAAEHLAIAGANDTNDANHEESKEQIVPAEEEEPAAKPSKPQGGEVECEWCKKYFANINRHKVCKARPADCGPTTFTTPSVDSFSAGGSTSASSRTGSKHPCPFKCGMYVNIDEHMKSNHANELEEEQE